MYVPVAEMLHTSHTRELCVQILLSMVFAIHADMVYRMCQVNGVRSQYTLCCVNASLHVFDLSDVLSQREAVLI
jgi:hypothetical protein